MRKIKLRLKKIPKKYQFKYDSEWGNFSRKEESSIIKELRKLKVEETLCPICNDKNLRIGNFGDSMFPNYKITCDSCEFTCPCGSQDYGEAKCEFDFWTEAFVLLGSPVSEMNNPDIDLEMYQEGISRDQRIKEVRGDFI